MARLKTILKPEDCPTELSILSMGCLPNGLRPVKALAEWDEVHFSNVEEAFRHALENAPEDSELQLDYATFLLFREQDGNRTRQILSKIPSPRSARFHRLLGLLAFFQEDYMTAVEHFTTVWGQETVSRSFADGINLAASLLRLGEYEKAYLLYQQLLTMTQDTPQQKQIEKILESLEQNAKE